MVEIRKGRPGDVPRAFEIWCAAVDATHGFLTPEDRAEIDEMVARDFLPNVALWLAVDALTQLMQVREEAPRYGESTDGVETNA